MITYKEALELLKTEIPVYYEDQKKRKLTGVTWRRDPDCLYATAEVLDEATNSISNVRLDRVYASEDEIESIDTSEALKNINQIIEILQTMKNCFIYEDVEKAKDNYNKLMRVCIKLDEAIMFLSEGVIERDAETEMQNTNEIEINESEIDGFDDRLEAFYDDEFVYED